MEGGMSVKRLLPIVVSCTLLAGAMSTIALSAAANPIPDMAWAVHYAGPHDSQTNTCGFTVENCLNVPKGDIAPTAPPGPGRYDVYLLGINLTMHVASTRYGICCDGPIVFNGWTSCSDFEMPTPGWPGSGEGNSQTWLAEQEDFHVTLGILDLYVYGGELELCICDDPRIQDAMWCDGASPTPYCVHNSHPGFLGCLGFGKPGYNPCQYTAVEETSWGIIKSLFR
jgi:hypothetical protein